MPQGWSLWAAALVYSLKCLTLSVAFVFKILKAQVLYQRTVDGCISTLFELDKYLKAIAKRSGAHAIALHLYFHRNRNNWGFRSNLKLLPPETVPLKAAPVLRLKGGGNETAPRSASSAFDGKVLHLKCFAVRIGGLIEAWLIGLKLLLLLKV